jgi:hypothetical protein
MLNLVNAFLFVCFALALVFSVVSAFFPQLFFMFQSCFPRCFHRHGRQFRFFLWERYIINTVLRHKTRKVINSASAGKEKGGNDAKTASL